MSLHVDRHARYTEPPLPLAGLHPVLTLQLNVTYATVSDSLKWVASIREPSESVEMSRWSGPIQHYPGGLERVKVDIEEALLFLATLRRVQTT